MHIVIHIDNINSSNKNIKRRIIVYHEFGNFYNDYFKNYMKIFLINYLIKKEIIV